MGYIFGSVIGVAYNFVVQLKIPYNKTAPVVFEVLNLVKQNTRSLTALSSHLFLVESLEKVVLNKGEWIII